jgi:hypothetical protein
VGTARRCSGRVVGDPEVGRFWALARAPLFCVRGNDADLRRHAELAVVAEAVDDTLV